MSDLIVKKIPDFETDVSICTFSDHVIMQVKNNKTLEFYQEKEDTYVPYDTTHLKKLLAEFYGVTKIIDIVVCRKDVWIRYEK